MNNYFNDEYTVAIADLGYSEQAEKTRDMIVNCETPFVIGISGRWGSGKTSMMKYLMASLGGKVPEDWFAFQNRPLIDEEEEANFGKVREKYKNDAKITHIHSIWFNPWEHENHDEPIIELLKEIRKYFSPMSKALAETKKLGSVAIRAGLDMLDGIFSIFTKFTRLPSPSLPKNIGSTVQAHGEKYEHENYEYSTRNQRFKLIFQNAVEQLLSKDCIVENEAIISKIDDSAKLVIFIDDLDRCEEATISKLLREIKQYLSTKRCVFVFGYDRHHVEKAISKTIQLSDKETRSYLEKLFQSTIYIKQPAEEIFVEFVKKKLVEYGFNLEGDAKGLSSVICKIIDPNPRRIKAFLTAFRFHSYNFKHENTESIPDDLQKLALITYLKVFHEPVYSVLESDNELLKDLMKVFELNNRDAIANHNQYFFYLEMRSHLQDYSKTIYDEKTIEREFLKNDENAENKFLTEVYEMQGRHKSYENFRRAFQTSFDSILKSETYGDIRKYL
ncbi:KAP family P-loop NTPase fold protein [Candidatus Magnetominusculus xianensis]|uniref:KAP P-loop domain-containing protein n=1 Tax=Candidatus Magnetominusculus xianensis TaxID=1748249 RepID=A0ABR5SDF1_9BACT|nr:P-loop NTPase fold protein [Candidatus Magnetominusculus xianensis]KWT82990.1 KAP P-loop domain-containing protein [Candidatus Magnetominusculus xianensis]MBF0402700.1 hypothetical protein [Nitrospirota bacterium]